MKRFIYFLILALASTPLLLTSTPAQKTVMIDPAGHAKQPGRKLYDSFERAETLKFAEALKKKIEQKSTFRVLLTRAPGEEIVTLQNASFANRTKTDLFLTIHLYKELEEKPCLQLYHLLNDTLLDPKKSFVPQDFVPINQAHCGYLSKTISLSKSILKELKGSIGKKFTIPQQALGLPVKPLQGIASPALCLEVGIHKDNDWEDLVEPLAIAILQALA